MGRGGGAERGPLMGEYDATLRAPEDITAAEALEPAMPIRPVARRRPNWTGVLAVALVAVVGFFGYLLVSGPSHGPAAATGLRPAHPHAGPAAAPPRPTPTHGATASPTPSPPPPPPPGTPLTPATAAA